MDLPFHIERNLIIDYSFRSYTGVIEGNRYIQHLFARVEDSDDQGDNTKQAGSLHAIKILLGAAINNRLDAYDVMDMTAEMFEIGEMVLDLPHPSWRPEVEALVGTIWEQDLLILESIELEPEFRGKSLGLYLIKDLINNYGNGVGLLMLNISKVQEPKQRRHLLKHFKSSGFQHFPRLTQDFLFMNLSESNSLLDDIILE